MEVYLRYSMAGRPIIRDIKMITTPGKKAPIGNSTLSISWSQFCVLQVYWKRTEVEFNARIDKNMTLTLVLRLSLLPRARRMVAQESVVSLRFFVRRSARRWA